MELPSDDEKRALLSAYAQVLGCVQATGDRPLVLPNGAFFPDTFAGDEPSVQRLLDRILLHAGLADMAAVVKFWGEAADEACGSGGCGSCAPTPSAAEPESAPRLVDAGDHWQVNVQPAEAANAVALSSALCRAVALAVLREADAPPTNLDLDLAVDLTAVALGLGVLLLEGSHMYRKACGGPSIGRATALGPSELSLLLALSAVTNGQSLRGVSGLLSPTQNALFSEAKAWVDSNSALTQALGADRERIVQGQFELRPTSSWLGRWLGGKTRAASRENADTIEELEAALAKSPLKRAAPKPKDPKLDEIRQLVDEALREG